jgi:hypothetical protein
MDDKDPVAVAGGVARAASLTPEKRREIAQRAAIARWGSHEKALRATHTGVLNFGNIEVECAVLEGGRRVVSERGILRALGREKAGGRAYQDRAAEGAAVALPIYLAPKSLKTFIPDDLSLPSLSCQYVHQKGGAIAHGIDASAIPKICKVWLAARRAGALHPSQLPTAVQAEIVLDGLADVGIIALVDEATGYQYDRARNALAEILEKFIRKELAAWASTFPPDYYAQLFRLRNLQYDEVSTKRPPLIGKDTRDIVYGRLAPGVLEELERLNPKSGAGHRRAKHFQWLTPDVGHPKLKEHLIKVTTLMQAAPTWADFRRMLDRALPKQDLPLLVWAATKNREKAEAK